MKATRILFSNPPWWSADDDGLRIGIRAGSRWPFTRASIHAPDAFTFGGYLPVPFFMCSAAAYARREFPEALVEIRDSIARGESYSRFMAHLDATRPDWLVIESATPCWEHDKGLIRVIAENLPATKIIVCGTIVAGCDFKLPEGAFAAVKGEYEKGVASLINAENLNPSFGKSTVIDFNLLTIEEMNALPFPMFDEACALHYADGCPSGQQFPQLQVWTSRGCPFRCSFCGWPGTMTGNDPDGTKPRRVRGHSGEWVEAMLRERLAIADKAGTPYRSIYIDDDTFNLTEKHTLEISAVMKRIGLPWSAMCRADTISETAWQAMKDAGCFGVKIGFESGSQRVIDQIINKRLNLVEAEKTAKFLRSIGMTVHGTFTIGMPGETHEEQQMTRDFIIRLHQEGAIDTHQLSGTAVIEGTPLANMIHDQKILAKYPGANPVGYVAQQDGQRKIEQMKT